MVFNVQVAPIGEKQTSNQTPSAIRHYTLEPVKDQSLVHVPADKSINKYPVRIFDLQPRR